MSSKGTTLLGGDDSGWVPSSVVACLYLGLKMNVKRKLKKEKHTENWRKFIFTFYFIGKMEFS